MSSTTKTQRMVQALSFILLALAAVMAVAAVAVPIGQLSTEADGIATMNLRPEASRQVLESATGVPEYVVLGQVDGDELTVVVRVQSNAAGESLPWIFRLGTTLGTAWWSAALAVMCYLLARILTDVSRGDPFTRTNVRRLLTLAGVVLLGSIGADALNFVTANSFYDDLALQEPLFVTAYFSLTPWLLAALAAAMAAAFQSARQIQDDVDGLV